MKSGAWKSSVVIVLFLLSGLGLQSRFSCRRRLIF